MKYNQKSIALGILATLAIVVGFVSCSKDKENNPGPEMKSVIHIVGHDSDYNTLESLYWKDGTQSLLGTEDGGGYADGIIADGSDIYVTGDRFDEQTTVVYWKNGIQADLTELRKKYIIAKITIESGSTYMAGIDKTEKRVPLFWKNNETPIPLELPENSSIQNIMDIEVIGDNCYVLGAIFNKDKLLKMILWKNGKALQIIDGTDHTGKSRLYKHDNNIFILGEENLDNNLTPTPTVWNKDGQATRFQHEKEDIVIRRMITDGRDLHTVGFKFDNEYIKAAYWKNGKEVWSSTDEGHSDAMDIAIGGEDIYIAGHINEIPTLWKNGEPTALSTISGMAYRLLITKEPVKE